MTERIQGDRLVVTGQSSGSHFPKKQSAMAQRFEADGSTADGPFHIEGSIYGRDLRFRGPGAALGPILGRGDVTLEPEYGKAPQRFLGGLHANGNISVGPRKLGFAGSPLAAVSKTSVVVRGDVIGEQVSLTDAVVFGNVRGRRVKLSRCIVFGQVIASEAAVIGSSTLLAYDAGREVRFEGPCTMVFPIGTSIEEPAFVPAIDERGVELPCTIAFLPALRALGSQGLTLRPNPEPGATWAPEGWQSTASELRGGEGDLERSLLRPVDWVRAEVETEVRRLRGKEVVSERVPSERYVLTIGGRALDFDAIAPSLRHATWMLRTALEFDHYSTAHQSRTLDDWDKKCVPEEFRLLFWATNREKMPAVNRT